MFKNFFQTAWRNLLQNKVFTILNISGLSIGIVVCLIIGIWLTREMSFDDFHPNSRQIFRLSNTFKSESESFSQAPSGPAFGAQLPGQLPIIQSACRIFREAYKFKYDDKQFFENNVIAVDSNFFKFFGFRLLSGQPQHVLGTSSQIVLSEKMAIKYFGKESPVGKTILLDNEYPFTVSGVVENAPLNSHIQYDCILPVSFLRQNIIKRYHSDINSIWTGGWPYTYVALANPKNWREAERQVNQVAAKFSAKDWEENKMSYKYFLQPLRDIHLKSQLRYDANNNGSLARVRIFSILGIIVLLLACINYTNLTTAGAIKRAKETSVRKVVGAKRLQLFLQFFLETLMLCTIAVIIAIFLLNIILPAFSTWIGSAYDFYFTVKNIFIALGFVILVSLIAGIYPAVLLSSFNPATALKGSFTQSKSGNVLRKSLVIFQFTITIALVAAIFIINRQMNFIKNRSLGFNSNAVLEIQFQGDASVKKQYASLRNELLSSPYILNVSEHGENVVGGLGNGWTTTENLKGAEISTSLYSMNVDTSYFNTYNMQLAAGRFFSNKIPTDTAGAALVNEAAVRTFGWQTPANAIGKRFGKGKNTQYVIGVVKDFNFENLHKPVEALKINYSNYGGSISLKIDAKNIGPALDHLKKVWKGAIPGVPLQYAFIDESIEKQYGNEQKMQGVFYALAGLSLLIACLGLFGLSIFIVERKIKEIGIRKVLGSSVSGIVVLLSKDFAKLVLISIVIATPIAWYFMNNWLQDFAYRISIGWWVFVVAGIIALVIAIATVSFQAIKAAIANPVKSLRTE
ncbi:MAG: ABC transporter permease [Ginsengibacter sp.]